MEKRNLGKHQPSCILAHDLINKLTVIVGRCDLLKERAPEDSECLKHLALIRDAAKAMAEELNQHQCRLDAMMRTGPTQTTGLGVR